MIDRQAFNGHKQGGRAGGLWLHGITHDGQRLGDRPLVTDGPFGGYLTDDVIGKFTEGDCSE
jgi:hypothetical protein